MGQDATPSLDTIRVDHRDIIHCCSSMFDMWLQRIPKASWKQLIEALKEVRLTQLASELEESLQPVEHWPEESLQLDKLIEEVVMQSGMVSSEPRRSQESLHLKFKGIIVWNNGCDECLNS